VGENGGEGVAIGPDTEAEQVSEERERGARPGPEEAEEGVEEEDVRIVSAQGLKAPKP
jgi:hypothetical protein